jgi:hypothetical protein
MLDVDLNVFVPRHLAEVVEDLQNVVVDEQGPGSVYQESRAFG